MDNFLRELEGQFPAKVGIQCSTLTFLLTSSWASGYEKLLVHLNYILVADRISVKFPNILTLYNNCRNQ